MADDDEVGYGKPPRESRWKSGQSGNPKGRPKAGGTGLLMEVAGHSLRAGHREDSRMAEASVSAPSRPPFWRCARRLSRAMTQRFSKPSR